MMIKTYQFLFILFLLMPVVACANQSQDTQTSQSHTAQKFQADEALQMFMAKISSSLKTLKTTPDALPAEVGVTIQSTVQDIFKTCKLEADADAAIHPILAEILKGATLLKKGEKEAGDQVIQKALENYAQIFDAI